MENFSVQINIIAIALVIIAITLVATLTIVLVFLLNFYTKFFNGVSSTLENLEIISKKATEVSDVFHVEAIRFGSKISFFHDIMEKVGISAHNIFNYLFKRKKNGYKE